MPLKPSAHNVQWRQDAPMLWMTIKSGLSVNNSESRTAPSAFAKT